MQKNSSYLYQWNEKIDVLIPLPNLVKKMTVDTRIIFSAQV